jgi:hypothetical protein
MASNVFKVTSVSQGGVTGVTGITVNNLGSGYTIGNNILFSGSVNVTPGPPNLLRLSNSYGEPLLSISASGEVIWHQKKPSEAAKQFTTAVQGNIDNSAVKRGALERAYLRGLEKCQRMFEQMDPEEAKEKLKKEIDQRREKNCWTTLMDSLETEDDA